MQDWVELKYIAGLDCWVDFSIAGSARLILWFGVMNELAGRLTALGPQAGKFEKLAVALPDWCGGVADCLCCGSVGNPAIENRSSALLFLSCLQ